MARLPPLWIQQGTYAAAVDRRLIGSLWPSGAVNGMASSVQSGTMNLTITSGTAAVPDGVVIGAGFLCTADAAEVVAIPQAPVAGTDRIDVVTVFPRDTTAGGAADDWIFNVISGQAVAANPTPPIVPAGQYAIAEITVRGGQASVGAADLRDRRGQPLAVPPPAVLPDYVPRGMVQWLQGPASPFTVTTGTPTVVLETSFTALAGRRYKLSAWVGYYGSGTATGTNNQIRFRVNGADTQIQGYHSNVVNLWASASMPNFRFDGTGAPCTFGINATSGAPAGASLTVGGNGVRLMAEDIGAA